MSDYYGLSVEYMDIDELKPYKRNAKKHPKWQIEQIIKSIEEFGMNDPIAIWGSENEIVEGHGRLIACKELGYHSVPVIRLDYLTDEQRKAYNLVHNKLTMNSDFDLELLSTELDDILNIDMTDFGFGTDGLADWFESGDKGHAREGEDEYAAFLDKFEAKHTTDDCYTPEKVYDAVAEWVVNEYGVDRKSFVRPFYPGGDYQNETYKAGDIVVDNPPFSILAEILKFYHEHGVKYFLFAPALTVYCSSSSSSVINAGVPIIYKNGASVNTSFVTNLEPHEVRARTAPDLYASVTAAVQEVTAEQTVELPSYVYPDEVLTAAMMNKFSKYGVEFSISRDEIEHIRGLDAQKEEGKAIFGSGYLLSEKAAAEKAAAEKAAAEKAAAEKAAAEKAAATRWQLSDREKAIVARLSSK